MKSVSSDTVNEEAVTQIQNICLDNIEFKYPSVVNGDSTQNDAFQIGPFSLNINRGEMVFLVGGNGCGKTTLLKVLTGLYQPTGGQLRVNDMPITRNNVDSFRNHISAIFSDFHLFQRLYGYEDIDPVRVDTLLNQLKISDKTSFVDGEFTTIKLSTGQRKRVALVAALLEDRDIILFDEWAADQDPHFRAYFYEVLLAQLKAQGKTILAITHDEKYWHLADRVIRLEYGTMVEPDMECKRVSHDTDELMEMVTA
jgi:putative ATP-binding cassette transporter